MNDDPIVDPSNVFYGVSFGKGVDMLLRDETLAPQFDAYYKDEETVELLERARLHRVNSYYRNTIFGALRLKSLETVVSGGEPPPAPEMTPTEEAAAIWAQRTAGAVIRGKKPKVSTAKDAYENAQTEFYSILEDLAKYDAMPNARTFGDYSVALTGALIGGLPTIENAVSWPIGGTTAIARMVYGGLQAGVVNMAVDPVIQALNMQTEIQKDYDWTQTALAGPMGFALGGGFVGAGEVLTKGVAKFGQAVMGQVDNTLSAGARLGTIWPTRPGEAVARALPEEVRTRGRREVSEEEPTPVTAVPSGEQELTLQLKYDASGKPVAFVYNNGPEVEINPNFAQYTLDLYGPGPEGGGIKTISVGSKVSEATTNAEKLEAALGKPAEVADTVSQVDGTHDFSVSGDKFDLNVSFVVKDGKIEEVFAVGPDFEETAIAISQADKSLSPEEVIAKLFPKATATPVTSQGVPIAEPIQNAPPTQTASPAPKSVAEWTKIGEQTSGNAPGGQYQDAKGIKWYIKQPPSTDHISNEWLANRIYNMLGVDVPQVKAVNLDGKPMLASRWAPPGFVSLKSIMANPNNPQFIPAVNTLKEDFAIDAWLGNRDVIGLTGDNVLVNTNNPSEVLRIDQGGALKYRGMGQPKTDFGKVVTEFDIMRDPNGINPLAGKIFQSMTDAELIKSIDKVAAVTPQQITDIVHQFGYTSTQERHKMINLLIDRQSDLIKRRDALLKKNVPVDANGKALPMDDKSRLERAVKMGFDITTIWYHGTKSVFEAFDIKKSKTEPAIFLARTPGDAGNWGKIIIPVYLRAKKIKVVPPEGGASYQNYNSYKFTQIIKEAKAQKYDAVLFEKVVDSGGTYDQMAILRSNLARNINAAFDPKKKASAKLAALEEPGAKPEEPGVAAKGEEDFTEEYVDFVKEAFNDEQMLPTLQMVGGKEPVAAMHNVPLQGEEPAFPNFVRPPQFVESLHQMSKRLAKTFGETIRQGGTGKRLGQYDPTNGVIRVRELPDFQVNGHEVGHSLAMKMTGDLELTGVGPLSLLAYGPGNAELRNLDYGGQQRVSEGFAEYIRLFLTNPRHLEANAPTFHQGFMNLMEAEQPQMLRDLLDFQQSFSNYKNATPEQMMLARVFTPTDTIGSKIVRMFTDAKVAPTIGNVLSLMYRAFVAGDTHDISRATRAMAERIQANLPAGQRTVELAPRDDPVRAFKMLKKFTQTAMHQVRTGVAGWASGLNEGPSIRAAIARAFDQSSLIGIWNDDLYQKWGAYMVARRAIHLWDKHEAGLLKNSPFNNPDESKAYMEWVVEKFDREYPQFREASDMVHTFMRNYLQRMTDSGAFWKLTPEAMERIVDSEPFYVPFNRDMSDYFAALHKGVEPPAGIAAIKGSMRDVIHPINSILNNLVRAEHQMAQAMALRTVDKLASRIGPGGGQFLERRPATEIVATEGDLRAAFARAGIEEGKFLTKTEADLVFDQTFGSDTVTGVFFKTRPTEGKGEPIHLWADDGVLQAARLSTESEGYKLHELLMTVPKPAADIMQELLGLAAIGMRATITGHVVYALKNLLRDQFSTVGLVPGFVPFWHAASGFVSVVRNDEYMRAYRQHGGVSPTGAIVPRHAEAVETDVKALLAQGFTVRRIASFRGLLEATTALELATRVGATKLLYKQKMKEPGMSQFDAMWSAVHESSDLLPFDRYGDMMGGWIRTIPFLGSFIQSMDKYARRLVVSEKRALFEGFNWITGWDVPGGFVFKEDSQEALKGLWLAATLGVGGYAFGMMLGAIMEGVWGYEDATPKIKASNIVLPINEIETLLIPKSWEYSLGISAGEAHWANLRRNDPRAAAQFRAAVWEAFTPPDLIWGNPIIGIPSNVRANYNSFTGGPIVPPEMAKRVNAEQWDSHTGALAKMVAKLANELGADWSPKKIQYIISNLGYYGKDMSTLGRGDQSDDVLENMRDMVFNRAGLRDPAHFSDASERFWKLIAGTTGQYSQAVNTYKQLIARPETETRALEFFDKLNGDKKAFVILNASEPDFPVEAKASHPLSRARKASSVLIKTREEIHEGFMPDGKTPIAPGVRGHLVRWIGQLALAEHTNALAIMGQPGYVDRPMIDLDVYMAQIENLSPETAVLIKKRYAQEKIYKTDRIAAVYDAMKAELLRDGSRAQIRRFGSMVSSGGYEFSGVREVKPRRGRRVPIPGGQDVQAGEGE